MPDETILKASDMHQEQCTDGGHHGSNQSRLVETGMRGLLWALIRILGALAAVLSLLVALSLGDRFDRTFAIQLADDSDWVVRQIDRPSGGGRLWQRRRATEYSLARDSYSLTATILAQDVLIIRGETLGGRPVTFDGEWSGTCMRLYAYASYRFMENPPRWIPIVPKMPLDRSAGMIVPMGMVTGNPTWVQFRNPLCGSHERRVLRSDAERPLVLTVSGPDDRRLGREAIPFEFIFSGFYFDMPLP